MTEVSKHLHGKQIFHEGEKYTVIYSDGKVVATKYLGKTIFECVEANRKNHAKQ